MRMMYVRLNTHEMNLQACDIATYSNCAELYNPQVNNMLVAPAYFSLYPFGIEDDIFNAFDEPRG